MKLLAHHAELIAHMYGAGVSPLEIAEELGLTFRQVCAYIDKHLLKVITYRVATNVPKATRAGFYVPWDHGFTNPFGRL